MWTIELIGSIDGQSHYSPKYVGELLNAGPQALALGSDFVGRPCTQLYVNNTDVIKVRTELALPVDKARAWLQQALHNEQRLRVHHPYKTWLLLLTPSGECQVGSICPRLYPVNIALKSAADRRHNLDLLMAVFKLYLNLAKTTGHKLDEGLSNFAFSTEGDMYYLDDEYYGWDDFTAFAVMLGVYIRTYHWFDNAFIEELGHKLQVLVETIFPGTHSHLTIAAHLQTVFMPNADKEYLLRTLIGSLRHHPPKTPPAAIVETAPPAPKVVRRPANGRFFALLGDIHANYPALNCVLDYLAAERIDQGIILGDIVGYGPDPKECIQRLQDSTFHIIKGNHDEGVASGNTPSSFSSSSKAVIHWTIGQLSADERQWLSELPPFIKQDDWYAVHGAPMDADYFYAYVYIMTYQDNLDYMQQNGLALCFHGHSHIPGVFARNRHKDSHETGQTVRLSTYQQALVCPGSVGQPRNGRQEAQFAIYDKEQQQVTFIGLPYDNAPVIAKLRQFNLPEELSLRLLNGR
ncbi:metallophosphoesterase family protein [Methylovulum psychrotolerans]|uniref:Calcineurin-like phosphoesterase domain-containing protein n=1 Tax=Methylovulum psychrotolerans TaxID=1704499 RepID=A0A1Z4C289_9GAMM|nr:metallophosphoesterase family protein [Methylovulum psychrotolerans]ASF47620.1 hypothetical protein CEK71_16980 [Methylovulum psychrotolerans]